MHSALSWYASHYVLIKRKTIIFFNHLIKFLSSRNMSGIDVSQYTVPNDSEVVLLECKTAFDALTKKEKLYAHYLSQAAWNGGLIVLLQVLKYGVVFSSVELKLPGANFIPTKVKHHLTFMH